MEEKEVIKMYKAFIQPYFLYGIEVWGHSVKSEKDILLRLQSKVLRIIFDCCKPSSSNKKPKLESACSKVQFITV